jgi:paraquat-inducible protein B
MGKRANPAIIGAFVLGALALVAAAVVAFGSGRLFRPTQSFVLFFGGTVNGLAKGAAVKFRGVDIGQVTDILLRLPEQDPAVLRLPVMIELDLTRMEGLGIMAESIAGKERSRTLIDAGLRGQLQLQSFITGVLFIGLDFFPGSKLELVLPPDSGYLEIPTLPTSLEQAQAKVQEILDRLSNVDVGALADSLRETIDGVNRLFSSGEVDATLGSAREALNEIRRVAADLRPQIGSLVKSANGTADDLRVAIKRLEVAIGDLQAVLAPESPLVYGATRTLVDLGEAARAVRDLADYLDRNPDALLTGRGEP